MRPEHAETTTPRRAPRICASATRCFTRFTLANASTESVHATARLWFSTDETWDAGDIRSATKLTKDVNAETSAPWAAAWEVPALNLGVDYYPIVRVTSEHVLSDGTTDAKSERTDWIPLRIPEHDGVDSKLRAKSACATGTLGPIGF